MATEVKEEKEKSKEKKVSRIKAQKKIWCKILAPLAFAQKEVGESYLTSPEKSIGRLLRVNLREFTGNMKDQNCNLVLQVSKVSGSQLHTVLIGYELTAAGVRRAIRKDICRMDDCFKAKTKSGRDVIVKTFMVTIHKTARFKTARIQKMFREMLLEELKISTFSQFVINLVNQKIQSTARKQLNKIYPLRELSVRMLQLKEKGLVQEEVVVEEKPAETPAETAVESSEVSEPAQESAAEGTAPA
ncbi:MAG: hypothetical protein AABY26_06735 [Nanoarchaeota archaeon]